jgi:hypothetical protein
MQTLVCWPKNKQVILMPNFLVVLYYATAGLIIFGLAFHDHLFLNLQQPQKKVVGSWEVIQGGKKITPLHTPRNGNRAS